MRRIAIALPCVGGLRQRFFYHIQRAETPSTNCAALTVARQILQVTRIIRHPAAPTTACSTHLHAAPAPAYPAKET